MYTEDEKKLALDFAFKLEARDYDSAYSMLSSGLQTSLSQEEFRQLYEQMIPQDWGEVDPIELVEGDEYPFVYVVLGGDVYSEAIVIHQFIVENGNTRIDNVEFGRP